MNSQETLNTSAQLIVSGFIGDKTPSVKITSAVEPSSIENPFRASPIYSLTNEGSRLPNGDEYFILFLIVKDPVACLGKMPGRLSSSIWFSLGLASILVIDESSNICDEIKTLLSENLSAYELWEINENLLAEKPKYEVFREVEFDPQSIVISGDFTDKQDINLILEEFNLNIHECASNASVWLPRMTPIVNGIAKRAKVLVELLEQEFKAFEELVEDESETNSDQAINIQESINTVVDNLISINSSLAYVNSQGFHGQIPILESSACLVRSYSLLGIGTAFQGFIRLINFIEKGTEENPIINAIATEYRKEFTGEVGPLGTVVYSSEYSAEENSIDQAIEEFRKEAFEDDEYLPKMGYFSNRYGFSQGPGIITAASQCLAGSDTVRWSYMTLTHEMMHAHFEALVTEIFSDDDTTNVLESILTNGDRIIQSVKDGRKTEFMTRIEAVKIATLYQTSEIKAAQHERRKILKQWNLDDNLEYQASIGEHKESIYCDLVDTRKIFEECIVHALDRYYFYQGNDERYVRALWMSWSTVPGVVENLEFYILRTLVSIGYDQAGPPLPDRFERACNILKQTLTYISQNNFVGSNSIAKRTTKYLENAHNLDLLKMLFLPLVNIVSLFHEHFFSNQLRLFYESGDDKILAGATETIYSLETGELSGEQVKNPIAFLADRLRLAENATEQDLTTERRNSAWLSIMLNMDGG